jgi:hypothetical protein
MQETERDRQPVKPSRTPFDESKLTPAQRKALEIAKVQGAKFGRKLKDLQLDVEPEAREELAQAIMDARREDGMQPHKNPFD